MDKEELNKILSENIESEILEFKEAKTQFDKDKLGSYFSALSNEANLNNKEYAWLFFGINDKKQIVGSNITENQFKKIRNLKYRYIVKNTLFPDEVDQYDPYIIREALNNCIAHQDYTMNGRINVVENEDGSLIFVNSGDFIPKTIENVIKENSPETIYRNPFLANAMVKLKLIDTIGSGIRRLFLIQRKKFFPLPDYDLSDHKVKVTIQGKVIDQGYALKLAQKDDLTLHEIMLLDKVQKNKTLNDDELKLLRSKNLVEGRKPNIYISSSIASSTEQQSEYIKQRGIDDEYCKKMIVDCLNTFTETTRNKLDEILLPKLPDVLTDSQKKNKIKNILQVLRRDGCIGVNGKKWILKK